MLSVTATGPRPGSGPRIHVVTYSAGGQRSVVKQTAIRTGNVLVIVSGSPGLVDAHLDKALAKARTEH